MDPTLERIVRPLQQRVREQELWACHLGPELGGPGYGQLKLALMNEVIGPSVWAPTIFGTQAPDTGNAEILAHYGTEEQKARYLQPLLDGDIVSCYSMTEPQGGSDPRCSDCRAVARRRRVGDRRVEVLLVERSLGELPDRDGGDRSRRADLPRARRCSSCRPTHRA